MADQTIRVLLIEDDPEDYVIARHLLAEGQGRRFDLLWCRSLAEGLQAVRSGVDAIVLDLSLPDSQGWETFVRARDASRLPIILVTGLDDEALGMRAIQEGAQDYLVKGQIDSRVLSRAVLYAIERRRAEERLANLAEELRSRNAQMEDDLAMAREVQQVLVLRPYPVFPPGAPPGLDCLHFDHVYRPCRTVGGDFFSVMSVSDRAAGIFVCDVMGHGMRAALVTAILRGVLEELRELVGQPARLMTEANRALSSMLRLPGQLLFASALHVVVDAQRRTVEITNAGHPPPMHIRTACGEAHWLSSTAPAFGPPLGVDPDRIYSSVRRPLETGDRLVLYTDGLYEVEDSRGTPYERDQLLRVAGHAATRPLDELLGAMVQDAVKFAGSEDFGDDVCLLGIELCSGSGRGAARDRGTRGPA